ncbi:phage head spike fiber domain-containing protein [Sphingobacterium kyonggiense]
MAGITVQTKKRILVDKKIKEVNIPTETLDTAQYFQDLTSSGATFSNSRINGEMNALPQAVRDNASFALIADARKTGAIYAFNGDTKSTDELEFQRGSSATYEDVSGKIQIAAANEPRLNFRQGTFHGYLIEPSSSNLLTDSGIVEGLGSFTTKSAAGLEAIDTDFNIGALLSKGARITRQTGISYAYKSKSLVADRLYTISMFVKLSDGSQPTSNDFSFIVQGSVVNMAGSAVNYGNGIFRVHAVHLGISGGNSIGVAKYPAQSDKALVFTGFQLEEGPVPTTYIPTTISEVTRLAERIITKRPILLFPKNSIFVKTLEFPGVWLGNGLSKLSIVDRNYQLGSIDVSKDLRSNNFTNQPIAIGTDSIGAWVTGQVAATGKFIVSTYLAPNFASLLGTTISSEIGDIVGKQLKFSVDVMCPQPIIIQLSGSASKTLVPNEWTRLSVTKTISNLNDFRPSLITNDTDNLATPVGTKVYLKNYKIELVGSGTWQPAPEDYFKAQPDGSFEISSAYPIHLKQLAVISRAMNQEEL